ncbi:hypothetical protein P885DRAFT_69276 [Corynascus similis CBS 632.67]
MAAQVPPDALGSAIAVLVYSLICLFSGFFFLWMVWVHDERKSFANAGDPELNITGASTGLDLVLFYIQYYSYNVESLLVFFWAVELANSIFQLRFTKMYRFHASSVAKATAALVPAAQMVLLRFSAVHKSTVGYMALADAISSLVLLAILCRYLHSRLTLASWNVGYGRQQPSGQGGTNGTRYGRPMPRRTIYDRWLVLRFSVAFCALSLFQIVVVNFQLRAAGTNNRANVPPEPDLSAGRARGDFTLFAPAPTAVLFVILVFGTTRTFRTMSRKAMETASCWGCGIWVLVRMVVGVPLVRPDGKREELM